MTSRAKPAPCAATSASGTPAKATRTIAARTLLPDTSPAR